MVAQSLWASVGPGQMTRTCNFNSFSTFILEEVFISEEQFVLCRSSFLWILALWLYRPLPPQLPKALIKNSATEGLCMSHVTLSTCSQIVLLSLCLESLIRRCLGHFLFSFLPWGLISFFVAWIHVFHQNLKPLNHNSLDCLLSVFFRDPVGTGFTQHSSSGPCDSVYFSPVFWVFCFLVPIISIVHWCLFYLFCFPFDHFWRQSHVALSGFGFLILLPPSTKPRDYWELCVCFHQRDWFFLFYFGKHLWTVNKMMVFIKIYVFKSTTHWASLFPLLSPALSYTNSIPSPKPLPFCFYVTPCYL